MDQDGCRIRRRGGIVTPVVRGGDEPVVVLTRDADALRAPPCRARALPTTSHRARARRRGAIPTGALTAQSEPGKHGKGRRDQVVPGAPGPPKAPPPLRGRGPPKPQLPAGPTVVRGQPRASLLREAAQGAPMTGWSWRRSAATAVAGLRLCRRHHPLKPPPAGRRRSGSPGEGDGREDGGGRGAKGLSSSTRSTGRDRDSPWLASKPAKVSPSTRATTAVAAAAAGAPLASRPRELVHVADPGGAGRARASFYPAGGAAPAAAPQVVLSRRWAGRAPGPRWDARQAGVFVALP